MVFVRKYSNRQRNDSRKLEFLILLKHFDICCSIINLLVTLNVRNISQFVCPMSAPLLTLRAPLNITDQR